jgi:putative addiction module component (TIGR02574 family)
MSSNLKELRASAAALPVKERGALAERLLASLDHADDTAAVELGSIATEALGLPADQRRVLAQRLLASLEDHAGVVDVEAVERAWIAEAERRYERYLAGETKAVPLEEALARIRARKRRV